jgi:CheY-like chemotaxis protein
MERIRILIVEDSPPDAELLVNELRLAGFDPIVDRVDTETNYRAALATHPEIVFVDFGLPNFSFHRALSLIRDCQFDIPIVIFSGVVDEDAITEYLKMGATDFVLKRHLARAGPVTRRALNEARQRVEFSRIQKIAASTGNFADGLASEFVTLLTAIQGNAEVLLSDATANDHLRKSIEHISSAASRAAKLAARMLPPKTATRSFKS